MPTQIARFGWIPDFPDHRDRLYAAPPEQNKHIFKKPTPDCYKEAVKHTAIVYERIPRSLNQMKACLTSGYPFVIGFSVYESFESAAVAKTGHAPMPRGNDPFLGG